MLVGINKCFYFLPINSLCVFLVVGLLFSCFNKIFAFSTCLWFDSFFLFSFGLLIVFVSVVHLLFWFFNVCLFCWSSFALFFLRLFVSVVHLMFSFSYVCLFLLFIFCFDSSTFICFCCSSFVFFLLRLFGEKQTDQWLIEKAIVGTNCCKISPFVLS